MRKFFGAFRCCPESTINVLVLPLRIARIEKAGKPAVRLLGLNPTGVWQFFHLFQTIVTDNVEGN
jgi:hypothetical protein